MKKSESCNFQRQNPFICKILKHFQYQYNHDCHTENNTQLNMNSYRFTSVDLLKDFLSNHQNSFKK